MSKQNQKSKISIVKMEKVEEQMNTVPQMEGGSMKEFVTQLVADYEIAEAAIKEQKKGQSLPYREIIEAVDTILDAVGKDRGVISHLVQLSAKLLKMKYESMGDSTVLVPVKTGSVIRQMPQDQLRDLRLAQLAHMTDPKVKDNMYRRIYGLGYRKEFKRFDLQDGMLVRIAKPTLTTGDIAPLE
jgi:hypothetical protein